jgi:hypothetical protein
MSNPNFNEYDASSVRKFLFHVVNSNRDDSKEEEKPIEETIIQPEEKQIMDIIPDTKKSMQMRIKKLENQMQILHEELAVVMTVCEQAVEQLTKTDTKILDSKEDEIDRDAKEVYELSNDLRKLDTVHKLLHRSGKFSPEHMQKIKTRIKKAKKKLKRPSP